MYPHLVIFFSLYLNRLWVYSCIYFPCIIRLLCTKSACYNCLHAKNATCDQLMYLGNKNIRIQAPVSPQIYYSHASQMIHQQVNFIEKVCHKGEEGKKRKKGREDKRKFLREFSPVKMSLSLGIAGRYLTIIDSSKNYKYFGLCEVAIYAQQGKSLFLFTSLSLSLSLSFLLLLYSLHLFDLY